MGDEQSRKQNDHRHVAALRILENETQWQLQPLASSQESLQLFTNRDKGGVATEKLLSCTQSPEICARLPSTLKHRRM